jgi:hypothetical protein
MVLTNGIYASEVWNYTRKGMDRLEKHYFRLLRSTLFLAKYDTTYLTYKGWSNYTRSNATRNGNN